MHVEVSHALTDDVVHRHERSAGVERLGHHRRQHLHPAEERAGLGAGQIAQLDDVLGRNHQRMTPKQRGTIEERDGHVVGPDDVGRR